mmetsp:Transcript_14509/g.26946  ORF Transcript_14509/g.26946 Transcript_14509/m.26946 type:complete len:114 (-) Transcript_14509:320-661(-)|eukprot:CAMPEP_0184543934 /NCGR_PEP_ID=MMETSP0199_2-20130426/3286_1 /TAXON_ID=1112570 /ORGANISM="Thraustochytrium sp., Strain LLF1b" /LENGTH=113 /DNA_ID=CAMNT_0026938039 /DNA_START=107 /DNA_END=448 /DNA_ORIENTATION=-
MQAAPAANGASEPELYDGKSVMINGKGVSYVRTIYTIASGIAAGTLGLTGMMGMIFYVVGYVLTSMTLLATMGDVKKYIPKATPGGFIFSGIGGEALAYVLYWTLFYALVHIY